MAFDKSKGMAVFMVSEKVFDELLSVFLAQADHDIAVIKLKLDSGLFREIATQVHSLKGSAGSLRLDEIFEHTKKIESAIKDERFCDIPSMVDTLEKYLDEIRQHLKP